MAGTVKEVTERREMPDKPWPLRGNQKQTTEGIVQLQALQIQKHLFIFIMLLNFVPVDVSHLSFGTRLSYHSMARYKA